MILILSLLLPFSINLSIHVWHLLAFNWFPLHILTIFTVKYRLRSLFHDKFFFYAKKYLTLYIQVLYMPPSIIPSFSSTISMLNKNNSADIHKNVFMHSFYHIFYCYPHLTFSHSLLIQSFKDDDIYFFLYYTDTHTFQDDIYILPFLYLLTHSWRHLHFIVTILTLTLSKTTFTFYRFYTYSHTLDDIYLLSLLYWLSHLHDDIFILPLIYLHAQPLDNILCFGHSYTLVRKLVFFPSLSILESWLPWCL
jgi:hypothetical protein